MLHIPLFRTPLLKFLEMMSPNDVARMIHRAPHDHFGPDYYHSRGQGPALGGCSLADIATCRWPLGAKSFSADLEQYARVFSEALRSAFLNLPFAGHQISAVNDFTKQKSDPE